MGPYYIPPALPVIFLSFLSWTGTVSSSCLNENFSLRSHMDNFFTPYFDQDKTGIFQNKIYLECKCAHTDIHTKQLKHPTNT